MAKIERLGFLGVFNFYVQPRKMNYKVTATGQRYFQLHKNVYIFRGINIYVFLTEIYICISWNTFMYLLHFIVMSVMYITIVEMHVADSTFM